ncbi:MAG: iron-containing alcohol dehydrogenase [Bacteroidales bacterium]|nr:iron-containing alcohol dehydrogenase [Bacteroidales bacterium]
MNNFLFQNPTKLIFGKGQIARLAKEIPTDKKILLTFGGGSVKQNGVYDQVKDALKNHNCMEFWGIEPNPTVETLRKAIALGKENQIDFLVAVGGGSVSDGTKLISVAIWNENDPWDIVTNPKKIGKSVPMATVLTLPATGSEMNKNSVISNTATAEKIPFAAVYPTFSILDPETTFSLPKFQVAVGIADTLLHVMEQYLTTTGQSPLMDRWAEGILQTLVEITPKIQNNQHDYEQMSNFMLCATMALNGFISMGVSSDWATHRIAHEITALHNTTHGQSLALIFSSLMRVMAHQKGAKIVQYGERVWNITTGSTDEKIEKTIAKTDEFFRSLGLATKLSELNIGQDSIDKIVARFKANGTKLGENENITFDVVKQILELAK